MSTNVSSNPSDNGVANNVVYNSIKSVSNDYEVNIFEGTVINPSQPERLAPVIPVTVKCRLGDRDSFETTIYFDTGSEMNMFSENFAKKNIIFLIMKKRIATGQSIYRVEE